MRSVHVHARCAWVGLTGGQPDPVKAHLAELSRDGFSADANDRRGVMYEALAADDWFINSGYEATG